MTLYLYAIVDAPPKANLGKGIGGRPVSLVRVGKAWVVTSEATAQTDDAQPAHLPPTIASIVAHDRVVRRVVSSLSDRESSAVLPLRFGSTVTSRAALATLLAPLSKQIASAFDRVRGAVQFTLRVTGKRARPAKLPRRVGPGTRFLATRVLALRVPEIDPLSDATRPFVRETRTERHDRPPLLASVYHLVPWKDVRRWRAAVRRSLPTLDVQVMMSGPWPPYAFTELG